MFLILVVFGCGGRSARSDSGHADRESVCSGCSETGSCPTPPPADGPTIEGVHAPECTRGVYSAAVDVLGFGKFPDLLLVPTSTAAAGSDGVEKSQLILLDFDRCLTWSRYACNLVTPAGGLSYTSLPTRFSCDELLSDVTFVTWVTEVMDDRRMTDCVVWGDDPAQVLSGAWDVAIGDVGPPGGWGPCRAIATGTP